MSSDTLKEAIQDIRDLNILAYYALGATTVLFYDYLLTLADEIEYAWSRKKSWIFVLFIIIFAAGIPALDVDRLRIIAYHPHNRCDKIAFITIFIYVWCTLLAQVAMTLRIYAVTGKNRKVTGCFCAIMVTQLALGTYFVATSAMKGAQKIPMASVGSNKLCLYTRERTVEIVFPAVSLLYDLLAFLVIIYVALKSCPYKFRIPSLFRTIAEDATCYFLVIFSSHVALETTMVLARPLIQPLPATGNVVFLPVMITRLLLSLRKASASQSVSRSFGEPPSTANSVRFIEDQDPGAMRNEIALGTVGGRYKAGRSGR